MYIDDNGKKYKDYKAYCNSKTLDPDIVGVMLSTGRRTPQSKYEEELLSEINKIKSEGKGIEFNYN